MKKQNLVKKTTAFVGAIAATSLLGLPAIAQMSPDRNTVQGYPYSNTDQGGYGVRGAQSTESNQSSTAACVPIASQSNTNMNQAGNQSNTNMNQANNQSSDGNQADALGPAADASQPGTRSFPNQTDPRAGSTLPTTNQAGNNQGAAVGGPIDDQSSARSIDYSSRTQASSMNQRISNGAQPYQYGDVLSFGGSTNGGHAREIVEAASDRDLMRGGNVLYQSSYSIMGPNKMDNNASNRQFSNMASADCGPGMMRQTQAAPSNSGQSQNQQGQSQNQQDQFLNRSTSETRDYVPGNQPGQPRQ